jgi:aubergine
MREENVRQILGDCVSQGSNFKERFAKMIIGTTVLTDYNNKTYKVSDIDWNQSPKQTFDMQGKEVSYAEYFKKRYNLEVRDLNQPLLIVKPTAKNIRGGKDKPILLIPEICRATGLTDQMRMNHEFTRKMSEHTRLTPRQTFDRISANIRRLNENSLARKTFEQNKMDVSVEPLRIKAEVLENESLLFGNEKTVTLQKGEWTHLLESNKMFKTEALKNWFFIYPKESKNTVIEFLKTFKTVTTRLSMPVEKPQELEVENRKEFFEAALQDIMRRDPFFIMVMVTGRPANDVYKAVKRITLISSNPVPVQVINEKNWNSKKRQEVSIATKIAIQVNCKIGGIPWRVDLKLKGMMIVGFDVSHDPRDKKKSYGAMVASLNPQGDHGGYYYSAVNHHENGEIISKNLAKNIIAAIRRYQYLHTYDGACELPKRILIYRDGVGDGQVRSKFHKRKLTLNLNL